MKKRRKTAFEAFELVLDDIIYSEELPDIEIGLCLLFLNKFDSDNHYGIAACPFYEDYPGLLLGTRGMWSRERFTCVLLLREFLRTDMERLNKSLKKKKSVSSNYALAA